MSAKLGPLYLIRGDDHGAIAARRARLRALAESESGGSGPELLDGPEATPEATARALAGMTLALGHRVVIVDGVERWRAKDIEDHLMGAIAAIPPDTTLALFAREESRTKVPDALVKAVKRAGGQVAVEAAVKPWELPAWTREQAGRLGLSLDGPASKALVAQVGDRPQRLLRELEKLALSLEQEAPTGTSPRVVSEHEVLTLTARSSDQRAYELADALLEGDRPGALSLLTSLRAQGESLAGLVYAITRRLRDAVMVSERLAGGESPAGSGARCVRCPNAPPSASSRRSPPPTVALEGGPGRARRPRAGLPRRLAAAAARGPENGLEEDSLAVRAVEAIAS